MSDPLYGLTHYGKWAQNFINTHGHNATYPLIYKNTEHPLELSLHIPPKRKFHSDIYLTLKN